MATIEKKGGLQFTHQFCARDDIRLSILGRKKRRYSRNTIVLVIFKSDIKRILVDGKLPSIYLRPENG